MQRGLQLSRAESSIWEPEVGYQMLEQDRRQRVQKLLPLMKRIERTLTIQKGRQKRDESELKV